MRVPPPKGIILSRIKPKYNPEPTKREKAFHLWLMENFACVCGCGRGSTVVHHPLNRHPNQRWRRDHEYVVPMFFECHNELHGVGNERKWRDDLCLPLEAAEYRWSGYQERLL